MASRNGKVLSLDNVASTCSLQVPGGPKINGFVSTHGVANYLNVLYAHIPARFRTAQQLDLQELSGSELDATQYGPRCPQPADRIHILMAHMFEQLPMEQYTEEFSCLDVNIYAPPGATENREGGSLPVFAWIHGGAFGAGDNMTECGSQMANNLVARSIRLGRPIVVVTINYRLNILGYLTSREIEAEAISLGETPIRSQGLNDQKLALQWIQRHIHLFGGDPVQVTAGGESAGAMSVHYLLRCRTDTPLFCRAVICSSPDVAVSLRSMADGQTQFDTLVASAGIHPKASYQVKLAALRSYSAQELIALLPEDMAAGIPTPFVDPAWFADWDTDNPNIDPEAPPPRDYWSRLPAWCLEVIVGSTKDEMALFLARDEAANWSTAEAQDCLARAVSPDPNPALVEAIWETPFLQKMATPLGRVITFGTHLFMKGPAHAFGAAVHRQCPNHRVYAYSIDIVDPFPGTSLDGTSLDGTSLDSSSSVFGPLRGFAWHSFGNALMFHQPACQRDAELGIAADKITEAHLDIIYGGSTSWKPFGVVGRKMSWNGSRSGLIDVGFALYDPVGDHLKVLGNEEWIKAYEVFKGDPSRLRILLG